MEFGSDHYHFLFGGCKFSTVPGDIAIGSFTPQVGDSNTGNLVLHPLCRDILAMAPVTYMPIIGATFL